MVQIKSPNADFTGEVVGVTIKNGVGETEDAAALAYFTRQGYEVGDGEDAAAPSGKALTPKQAAVARAKELEIKLEGKQTAEQILELIAAREAEIAAEATAKTEADAAAAEAAALAAASDGSASVRTV